MPTRADMQSAIPRCLKQMGPVDERRPCCRPMRFSGVYPADSRPDNSRIYGHWVCPIHGPMLSGEEAAFRAGYTEVSIIRTEAAA